MRLSNPVRSRSHRRTRPQLHLEPLERRDLLAVITAGSISFDAALEADLAFSARGSQASLGGGGPVENLPTYQANGSDPDHAVGSLLEFGNSGESAELSPNGTERGGVRVAWNARRLVDQPGVDFVIGERGGDGRPEFFVVRVQPVGGTPTDLLYKTAEEFYSADVAGSGDFLTGFDLTADFGLAPGTQIDYIEILNLLDSDQVTESDGTGFLTGGTFDPVTGPLDADGVFEANQFDADISFVWAVDEANLVDTVQGISATRVATGLDRPVFAGSPPGDSERLFIVEQHTGQIKILDLQSGTINPTPFIDIDGLATGSEQGLLGLAFHPDFLDNGYFYVNLTVSGSGTTHIRRYQVSAGDPDVADPNSALTILTYSQPAGNHNAGWMDFGPDGYLYVASGDGGGSNDTGGGHTTGTGNAQDITDNLLGKILRLDVDDDDFEADANRNYAIPADNPFVGVTGDDEIWAYGLRNPWRNSFDRLTGELYIGDVGQGTREEINVQPSASTGGENYGWRLREGTIATPANGIGGPKPPGAIDPIYDYAHGGGPLEGFSTTGGYVYRGPVQQLRGMYFFADYVNANLWSMRFDGSDPATHDGKNFTDFIDWTDLLVPDVGSIGGISSFGEDEQGNLYIVELFGGGEIFRIDGPTSTDAQVVGQHLFYNNSAWDGNGSALSTADYAAIAPDKVALLPGGTGGFVNTSGFFRGITGIVVDISGLANGGALNVANDFQFRRGNNDDPDSWADAADPSDILVRPGEGAGGSDRVLLGWPDVAVRNTWLEVTVLATANTGLTQPHVFYFASVAGETGQGGDDFGFADTTDQTAIRTSPTLGLNIAQLDNPLDIDRSKKVDSTDRLIIRTSPVIGFGRILPITVPGPGGGGGASAGETATSATLLPVLSATSVSAAAIDAVVAATTTGDLLEAALEARDPRVEPRPQRNSPPPAIARRWLSDRAAELLGREALFSLDDLARRHRAAARADVVVGWFDT